MAIRKGSLLAALAGLAAGTGWAQETNKKELTARELFYTPVEAPKAAKPVARAKPAPRPARTPPRPAPAENARRTPPPPPLAAPDGTPIVAVRHTAPAPAAGSPLGLRYTITRLTDGKMVEVAPDTVFRAGDRIRMSIMANTPGYLYMIAQGSSGVWRVLFPSPEIEDGNNRVEGLREYMFPPKSRMIFDSQPGTEKLFLVLSREPEKDLEQTIYSLQSPSQPAAAPAPEAPRKDPPRTMIAASIGNEMVNGLRNVYARDLVIETVDEETPGEKKENAMYVVNPSGSPGSRVVADISLVHR